MILKKILWIILLVLIAFIGPAHSKENLQKVKIASGGHIVHFLPLDLAVALGYFEDEGLKPEIVYLKSGTPTAQALLSKQVDFATNSIDHAYKAAVQGRDDLRMVVLLNQTPGMVLVVGTQLKDKVKRIADLKGKRLGVTSIGSATHMVLAFLLSKNGINTKDVTIIDAGSSTFPPALKNNNIDGGIALEPFASAMVNQGDAFVLQRLISLDDSSKAFGGPYNQAGIMTRQKVIDANPELVQRIVSIHIRALRYIQEHKEEDIAAVLPVEVTGSDKESYIQTLRLLKSFYSPSGFITPEGANNVFDSMKLTGALPNSFSSSPAQYYTNAFISRGALNNTGPSSDIARQVVASIPWLAFFLGVFSSAAVAWPLHRIAMNSSRRSETRIDSRITELESKLKYVEYIDSLDGFCEHVLMKTKEVKAHLHIALPLPVLYAVQDANFTSTNYEDAWWWNKFNGPFIDNLRAAAAHVQGNREIRVQLVFLCEHQLRRRALELFNDDTKVEQYVKVVEEFIAKLRAIPKVKLECDNVHSRVFDLPFWLVVVDHNLPNSGSAIVAFTDPSEVTRKLTINGATPSDIAHEVKGITVTEEHALGFFHRSFVDIKSRLYFYELLEQIRNDLRRSDPSIDMAFIHKWEHVTEELQEKLKGLASEPNEVLIRRK